MVVEALIGLGGAVGGVVVGGVMSYVTTARMEQSRWQRESAARWEGRLVEAISEYASVLKMQARLCLRIAGSYWPTVTSNPIDRAEGAQPLLASRMTGRPASNNSGSSPMRSWFASARAWQQAVWASHVIKDGPDGKFDRVGFQRAFEDAGVLRDDFYESARKALGVSGSLDPTPKRPYR